MMVRTRGAGGIGSPIHVHKHEDELFLMLEGSGIFWAGDQRQEVSAGGVAFLPRGLPHAYDATASATYARKWGTTAALDAAAAVRSASNIGRPGWRRCCSPKISMADGPASAF